jgi:hypothetical protein
VQRAKQLAQLTNFQFGGGRGLVPTGNGNGNGNGAAHPSPSWTSTPAISPAPATAPAAIAPMPHTPRITPPPASSPLPRFGEQRISSATPVPEPVAERTTEQKIEEFYGIKQLGNEVLFSAHFEQAHEVMIAGDFNGWNPVSPLQMVRDGDWRVKLPLAPGRYRYRFIVDGKWVTDPHNTYVEANQFGELNNVVEVE